MKNKNGFILCLCGGLALGAPALAKKPRAKVSTAAAAPQPTDVEARAAATAWIQAVYNGEASKYRGRSAAPLWVSADLARFGGDDKDFARSGCAQFASADVTSEEQWTKLTACLMAYKFKEDWSAIPEKLGEAEGLWLRKSLKELSDLSKPQLKRLRKLEPGHRFVTLYTGGRPALDITLALRYAGPEDHTVVIDAFLLSVEDPGA